MKAGIIVNIKQVCPSDIFQDLSVLLFSGVWTNANHDNSDTSRLKVKLKSDCCKLTLYTSQRGTFQSFIGGSALVQPLTLSYTILTEKVLLSYTFISTKLPLSQAFITSPFCE